MAARHFEPPLRTECGEVVHHVAVLQIPRDPVIVAHDGVAAAPVGGQVAGPEVEAADHGQHQVVVRQPQQRDVVAAGAEHVVHRRPGRALVRADRHRGALEVVVVQRDVLRRHVGAHGGDDGPVGGADQGALAYPALHPFAVELVVPHPLLRPAHRAPGAAAVIGPADAAAAGVLRQRSLGHRLPGLRHHRGVAGGVAIDQGIALAVHLRAVGGRRQPVAPLPGGAVVVAVEAEVALVRPARHEAEDA